MCIAPNSIVVFGFKGIVGGGIDRIFNMFAALSVGKIIWVVNQFGKFVFGIMLLEQVGVVLCGVFFALLHVEQK